MNGARLVTAAEILSSALPELPESDAVEHSLNRVVVGEALSWLSPDHRRVLLECYLRGASVREAAVTLGIPVGTVKSRVHYALQAFKLALAEIGGVM